MTTKDISTYRRVIISFGLSALLITIGGSLSYGLTLLRRAPETRSPKDRRYNIEVYALEAVDLREIVHAFGTVQPEKEVVLSAQVAGEISEIHPLLKVGLQVQPAHSSLNESKSSGLSQGDLLARIDPSTYSERVTASKNRLSEDQSDLKRIEQEEANLIRLREKLEADFSDSKREYQKVLQLREKGVTTDSELRRAQMDLRQHEKTIVQSDNERDLLPVRREQAQRRIESHRADLKLSELELTRTFIRPPFGGVLSSVQIELGQYVRVGDPLVTITAMDTVEVPLALCLDDYTKLIPLILERQFPVVELAEGEGTAPRWTGHVVRMSPKADEHTRTATVFVRVENASQTTPLLPGAFIHARIEGPVIKRAKAVPRDAVLGGRAFVEHDGRAELRQVTTSRMLNGFALIDSGLNFGDRVVLTNLDVLFDGASVHALQTRSLAEELARQRTRSAKIVEPSATIE